jgi:hypothetical protein
MARLGQLIGRRQPGQSRAYDNDSLGRANSDERFRLSYWLVGLRRKRRSHRNRGLIEESAARYSV